MKQELISGRFVVRFVSLLLCLGAFGGALAQDGSADQAIKVVREGIPHDALYALDMDGENGLAVGAFGLMLETTDGGATWKTLPPKTPLALLGIARAGDRLLVVGQNGIVMTKQGDGDWEMVDSGIEQRLLNVGMNESGVAVAVGEFGFVSISKDYGNTWGEPTFIDWEQYNEDGYEPHLYDAIVEPDGRMTIAGEFGLILRSSDGGQTWPAMASGDESVFDVHMASDGSRTGFAVGQEGLILKTTDKGDTWQRLDAGTNANLLGVWSGNSEVVVTGIRQMLRSSDGGASWSMSHDTQIIRTWFQGVDAGVSETPTGETGFLREQSVYVVGHRGTVARVVK
ncbi:MAG: WD40/YVTN/BNR-like repeat-containing protein [Gammaproteobacteria bacterium]